jgi:hypothetical protein
MFDGNGMKAFFDYNRNTDTWISTFCTPAQQPINHVEKT